MSFFGLEKAKPGNPATQQVASVCGKIMPRQYNRITMKKYRCYNDSLFTRKTNWFAPSKSAQLTEFPLSDDETIFLPIWTNSLGENVLDKGNDDFQERKSGVLVPGTNEH